MVGTTSQTDTVTIGRVLQAADDLIDELNHVGPTFWVVDDLHWSDVTSRDVLAYLIAGLDAQRLGLVLLVRAEERTEGHPLNVWLADLRRDPAVRDLVVGRLTAEETEEQVAALCGTSPCVRPRHTHPPADRRQPVLHRALRQGAAARDERPACAYAPRAAGRRGGAVALPT